MKNDYVSPYMELIYFNEQDVIRTSGETGDNTDLEYGGWAPDVD